MISIIPKAQLMCECQERHMLGAGRQDFGIMWSYLIWPYIFMAYIYIMANVFRLAAMGYCAFHALIAWASNGE